MNIRLLAITVILIPFLFFPRWASSFSVEEFTTFCHSIKGECSEHPIVQAYVGGALDLIATLDEETDYLAEVYCKQPTELFDVPAIIQFMQEHQEEYANKNAMLLFVRYLEEKGGC